MRRRVPTAEGLAALAEAAVATDLVREARSEVSRHAERRRRAVLRANLCGASYGRIAEELGVSVGNVQQIVMAARAAERARP